MTRTLCRDCCGVGDGPSEVCARCGGTRLLVHAEIESLGIAHIDCDAFYASVEKRDRQHVGQAVIRLLLAAHRALVALLAAANDLIGDAERLEPHFPHLVDREVRT